MFYSKNNVGKTVGYGALVGFAVVSIPLFLLGLADKDAPFGTVAIVSGLGGVLGGLIGALTGLFISSAGNEPEILDLTMPLTYTEKMVSIIKFLNRLNN